MDTRLRGYDDERGRGLKKPQDDKELKICNFCGARKSHRMTRA